MCFPFIPPIPTFEFGAHVPITREYSLDGHTIDPFPYSVDATPATCDDEGFKPTWYNDPIASLERSVMMRTCGFGYAVTVPAI